MPCCLNRVSDESFATVLTEVEAIINSRPLTPVSVDPASNEPLNPNHLLLVGRTPDLACGVFKREDNYARRRWRQIHYLADQFWIRWTREYLQTLHAITPQVDEVGKELQSERRGVAVRRTRTLQ